MIQHLNPLKIYNPLNPNILFPVDFRLGLQRVPIPLLLLLLTCEEDGRLRTLRAQPLDEAAEVEALACVPGLDS